MNIHCFQHVPFEGPGSIGDWVLSESHQLGTTRFYHNEPLPEIEEIDLLLVMGGPMNIYEETKYPWLAQEKRFIERAIVAHKLVLGICLGAQLVADVLGAKVYANADKEIGWFPVEMTEHAHRSNLFTAFPTRLDVFHWHGDTFDIPEGAMHLAHSAGCANQAFVYDERVVGLQFHLETTPASAQQIITHCADEIVEGRYIQTPQVMLGVLHRFDVINQTMWGLLDRLAADGPERNTQKDGTAR